MGEPKSVDTIPILKQNTRVELNQTNSKQSRSKKIKVCSWNIRRGLIIREEELKSLIRANTLNVIFLVETDTNAVNVESDFKISGFKTIIQNKEKTNDPTRVVCLIDEKMAEYVIIRTDLASKDFPSLWIEMENENGKNVLCCGFYREWAPNGDKSIGAQVKSMQKLTGQIEEAAKESKTMIILGDANLCSIRWDSPNYTHKKISTELRETLIQCGLSIIPLGITYTADRLNEDGSEITSALDHIYFSTNTNQSVEFYKLDNSATDHVPIIAELNLNTKAERKPDPSQKTIRKRSMKNFTKKRWIDCLRNRDWSSIYQIEDVEGKTSELTKQINEALDECAPYKNVKIRQNFKPGLSDTAKKLIMERDLTRKELSTSKNAEKPMLKAKYKKLRNRTIAQIRKDTIQMNGEKITKAGNERETWKIVNEIVKPKSQTNIVINGPNGETSDEQEVADLFNTYFVEKISALKENINQNITEDPLERIRKKMKNKNLSFKLQTVKTETVKKLMKKMANKKSKGKDGIPQDCLLQGHEVIAAPLTSVINCSIATGIFPEQWKEAIVIPILKKGDTKETKNYRPVSCLPAASKVVEKVICEQLTRFVEVHGLLPTNQHGFRAKRSTMTALSSMQKDWVRSAEEGLMTGVLVWDLSAAFDTLDIDLLLKKLAIYGADETTLNWFRSFLTNRTQRVRIGGTLSSPLGLETGVPQGGILSPIVFTLYTADMELWIKHSTLVNFADDTTTYTTSKEARHIKDSLEEDAKQVLKFMASNGLIANETKTEFLLLNEKQKDTQQLKSLMVGEVSVQRTNETRLLGVVIDEAQDWSDQLNKLISSLNQRLFFIRRIARQIPRNKLINVVHSIWMSKLRYGLQLCLKVRLIEEDAKISAHKSLQTTQNRMLRALNGTRIKDKVSTKSMLEKYDLMSVNQLAATIKLTEVWKIKNQEQYPLKLEPYNPHANRIQQLLRNKTNRVFNDSCRLKNSESSFHIDAARVWNAAPESVQNALTLSIAKSKIKIFCKTLPV